MTLKELLRNTIINQGGFLVNEDIEALAKHDRLRNVLIRCNGGRFTTAVQNARHYADIIDASQVDWVRDVSLLASDPAYAGNYLPVTNDAPPRQPMLSTPAAVYHRASGSYVQSRGNSCDLEPSDADNGL